MNYYIEGNAAKADQIKAAFERLGYETRVNGWNFNSDRGVYFTNEADKSVNYTGIETFVNLIKTHPDYKELELPVEPKFKVGDWIVKKMGGTFYDGNYAEQITFIEGDGFLKCIWFSSGTWLRDNDIRFWTIADAKDGDVLVLNGKPFIYSHGYGKNYCYIDSCGQFRANFNLVLEGNCVQPATKEQRDLLFTKMKEAGYQWDAEKKELRKIVKPKFKAGDEIVWTEPKGSTPSEPVKIIQLIDKDRLYMVDRPEGVGYVAYDMQDYYKLVQTPHYDIKNFEPLDPVLVRQNDSSTWGVSFFGRCSGGMFMCCSNVWFEQCIPFSEKTKHLLGTTDMCPDEYINW